VIFNEISTGALSDLEKVTKQAYAMVTVYGLNKAIGNISFYDSSGNSDYNFTKPYSEKTSELIDHEVKKIVDLQYERAKELLTVNKDKLDLLATQLLEKEVIFKENLQEIFGKRPYDKEEPLIPHGEEKKSEGTKPDSGAEKSDDHEKPPSKKVDLKSEASNNSHDHESDSGKTESDRDSESLKKGKEAPSEETK